MKSVSTGEGKHPENIPGASQEHPESIPRASPLICQASMEACQRNFRLSSARLVFSYHRSSSSDVKSVAVGAAEPHEGIQSIQSDASEMLGMPHRCFSSNSYLSIQAEGGL